MHNKKVVLHITAKTGWGAWLYTMDIHRNMIRDGYDSYVCTQGEQLMLPSGETISIPYKKASFFNRMRRCILKKIINRNDNMDMKYAPYNLFEHMDFYDPNDLLKVLPQKPTYIMVHWVSGYANAKYVRKLQEMTGAKVYYMMIDEACISGGCHYPWDCEGYKTGCKDCPMTKSTIIKRTIRKNFLHKLRYVPSDAEVVLPTDVDRIRLEQSQIWKGHTWHKMLEIVSEETFYPEENTSELKTELGLPLEKKLILFGSSYLDEERKGMRVLIAALQKIERGDVVCVVIGIQDELDINLPNIRLGRVNLPTLAKLYRVADVFVCPSLEDSGPQMINQSVMSGTPVVAFEMGVALDIVKTGETGYLAKWNNAEDLAKGINYVLDMPKDAYAKMKVNCRKIAMESFSRDKQSVVLKEVLNRTMKVLFVSTNENYGGASHAAYRIMRGVQKHGVEVQMFVKNKSSRAEDVISLWQFVPTNPIYKICDWVANKIKNQVQHFRWRPYTNRDKVTYLTDLRSIYIHGALQKMDYDILHLNWFHNRFLDIDELKKIKKPIVWTLHDSWAFTGVCHCFIRCEKYQTHCGACPLLKSEKERDLSYKLFDKKALAYKDLDLHIVTPSRWLGESVKKSAILGRFPVTVIPNCLDIEIYRPRTESEIGQIAAVQKELPLKQVLSGNTDKPVILFGAVNANKDKLKGYNLLLAALHILDAQGLEARLVVFGAAHYDELTQFKHIEVVSVGFINDIEVLTALYSMADVMVVPSYSEVFGQTASEAMSCGTPVVAFRCTGIQDVVAEGCGYLAEPYDIGDLAKGILYCIENNPDNELGKAAREYVVNHFAIDLVAEQYKRLYESIL